MRNICLFILFIISIHPIQLLAENHDLKPVDAARYQALTNEIRCLVCQSQSIADSNAPIAEDLRRKIFYLIKAHQSDAEIKNYLVDRYGEYILLNPRFNRLTSLLWLFPAICLIITFSLFIYYFKKRA